MIEAIDSRVSGLVFGLAVWMALPLAALGQTPTEAARQQFADYVPTIKKEEGPITKKKVLTGDLDRDGDTDVLIAFGTGAEGEVTLKTHAAFYEQTDQGVEVTGGRTMEYCSSFQRISEGTVVVNERRSCAVDGSAVVAIHRYTYADGALQRSGSADVGAQSEPDPTRLDDLLSASGTIRSEIGGVMGYNPTSIEGQDAEHLDLLADAYEELQTQRRALYRNAIAAVAEERRPLRRDLAARVEARLSETELPVDSVEAAENYRPAVPWVNRALVLHTNTTLETSDVARWVAWPLLQNAPGVKTDSTSLPEGRSSPPAGSAVFDSPVEPGDVGIERIVVEGADRRVTIRVEGAIRDADRAARRLAEKSDADSKDIGDLRAVLSVPVAFEELFGTDPPRTCPAFTWLDGKKAPFLAQTARWVHLSDSERPELAVFTYGCSKEPSTQEGLVIAEGSVSGDRVRWEQAYTEEAVGPSSAQIGTDVEGRDVVVFTSGGVGQGWVVSNVRAIVAVDGTYETIEVVRYTAPGGTCIRDNQYRYETLDEVRIEGASDEGLEIAVSVKRATAPVPDQYDSHCDARGEWEPPEPTVEVDRFQLSGGEVQAVEES